MLVRVDSTLTTTAVILHRDPISLDHRYGNTREEDLARREPAGTCFLLLVFLATLFCIRASARVCKTRRQRRARVVPRSVPEPSLLISRRHTIDRSIDREINVHGRGEQRYDSKSFDFTVFFFFFSNRGRRDKFSLRSSFGRIFRIPGSFTWNGLERFHDSDRFSFHGYLKVLEKDLPLLGSRGSPPIPRRRPRDAMRTFLDASSREINAFVHFSHNRGGEGSLTTSLIREGFRDEA